MTQETYVLGIDSGTSSTKAIVWDLNGQIISSARYPMSYFQPMAGWAEQNAEWWWESTIKAIRESICSVDPARIVAVGLSWQRETWVPLGDDGKPVRAAMLWMDARGEEEIADLRSLFGERFSDVTGKPLDVTPSIFKIVWLRKHEPALFAGISMVLDVGAYLTRALTGEIRTCSAGSDTMGLMDMRKRDWSSELVEYAGLTVDQLPELVDPGERLGTISAAGAQATGLLEGTPLIAGGGDGQCSAIGAGVLDSDTYGMSLGTGLSMNVHMPDYVYNRAFRTLIGCLPNSYLAEVNTRACSLIIQWFVREFERVDSNLCEWLDVTVEDVLDLQMKKIPPGSDGLLTLPYWRGAMMPHNKPLVRGVTLGWSDYHTKAHFYRSLLEGLAFEFRQKLEAMEMVLAQPCNIIHISGGGSQSREWCQIISDITHRRVSVTASAETTCLGAAMLAATSVGAYSTIRDAARAMTATGEYIVPLERNILVYDKIYNKVYVHLLPTLEDTLVELKRITALQ